MKRVAMVSPHFVPSNLVGAQRVRLLAKHLPSFGWDPVVVTVDARFYEEALDPELSQLLSSELTIVRTSAWPVRPFRMVGDLGIRGFSALYRALKKLTDDKKVDLVFITLPSNFAALLGPLIKRRSHVPYVLDFMDPWAHDWPGSEKWFTRAWLSRQLAYRLEPMALRSASLVTSVAAGYYQILLRRYPWLSARRCLEIPYGIEPSEFDYLRDHPRPTTLFNPNDGNAHFVYAGALLPRAYGTLDALLQSVHLLKKTQPGLASRIRLHFIGTGSDPKNPKSFTVQTRSLVKGIETQVHETPQRLPYIDVLNHLCQSAGVLIIGSSEAHYSPSKTYQVLLSRRPVIALLHSKSGVVDVLRQANAGSVITFDDQTPVAQRLPEIVQALEEGAQKQETRSLDLSVLKEQMTPYFAGRLARAFDQVIQDAAA